MTKSLMTEVREDQVYKKFTQIFENAKKAVNVEEATNEVLGLHAGRTSRVMIGENRYSPKAMLEANSKDMSARARMSELRVKTDLRLSTLRQGVDAMRKHILTTYAEDLKEEFGGVTGQKAFADRVMKSAREYLAEGETLLSTIDTLIKDIDAAGHGLHRMGELLKLLSEGKGRVL
jgi:hypothetical protein